MNVKAIEKSVLNFQYAFFSDINLLRDFRYILADSICADAHDMLPYGNEIYRVPFRVYQIEFE